MFERTARLALEIGKALLQATRSCSFSAIRSNERNVCSMLCMVPTIRSAPCRALSTRFVPSTRLPRMNGARPRGSRKR